MTKQHFIDSINNGTLDNDLDLIIHLAQQRRMLLKPAPKISSGGLTKPFVGQTVKFNSNVNPKYLFGHRATIVKVNRTRVKVMMASGGVGRFSGTKPINCPLSILSDDS